MDSNRRTERQSDRVPERNATSHAMRLESTTGLSGLAPLSPCITYPESPETATRPNRAPEDLPTQPDGTSGRRPFKPEGLSRSKSTPDHAKVLAKSRALSNRPSLHFNNSIRSPQPPMLRLGSTMSVAPSALDQEDRHLNVSYGALPMTPNMTSATTESSNSNGRQFYDDFTTIDWVRDTINDSSRREFLNSLSGIRGRLVRILDGSQGWVLITLVAFSFAVLAYTINEFETLLFDLKFGICTNNPFARSSVCCAEDVDVCKAWKSWSDILEPYAYGVAHTRLDFIVYFVLTVLFAFISTTLTIRTKTSNYVSTQNPEKDASKNDMAKESEPFVPRASEPLTLYSAYGSGVPEVKTILSWFVIRRFLGTYTLVHKSIGLVFSIASGMALGKEGPFVHLATCVGNISCRLFPKYAENDMKRRQILSAASSAGVALAFGSPLGGVLFSLEELSYHFLPHHLFRIFFCAMMSGLFLKFLDPYKTGKIVLFEVSYDSDWHGTDCFCVFGRCWGHLRLVVLQVYHVLAQGVQEKIHQETPKNRSHHHCGGYDVFRYWEPVHKVFNF